MRRQEVIARIDMHADLRGKFVAHKYEIYVDRAGQYRVRFKYNSEVMWSSEGYSNKASALDLIQSLKKNAPGAPVNDIDDQPSDLKKRLERASVPAANRVVQFDHNSKEFREFETAYEQLKDGLRKSNDLGGFSTEEVEVAKQEVAQLGGESKRDWIRPAHVWEVAKSTLFWIFQQAAGAAIGAIALAALAALANLLGIVF